MLIAFKLKLVLACAAGLAGPLAVAPLFNETGSADQGLRDPQAFVELQPRTVSYRAAGDFTRAGKQAASPLVTVRFNAPLTIMKNQTSSADYQRCVDDGACQPLDRGVTVAADRPVVQVSWHDATAYAAWLSKKTGEHYRLPTDEEWAFAAGSKFRDDGLPVDESDPSKRWLALMSANPIARLPIRRPMPSAALVPMKTACSISAVTSGNGPTPASCAPCWTIQATRARRAKTAACGSPRGNTAPTSPTSSATPAPAAAPQACRRAISDSGWSASRNPGRRPAPAMELCTVQSSPWRQG
jgi:hypothetical protein